MTQQLLLVLESPLASRQRKLESLVHAPGDCSRRHLVKAARANAEEEAAHAGCAVHLAHGADQPSHHLHSGAPVCHADVCRHTRQSGRSCEQGPEAGRNCSRSGREGAGGGAERRHAGREMVGVGNLSGRRHVLVDVGCGEGLLLV